MFRRPERGWLPSCERRRARPQGHRRREGQLEENLGHAARAAGEGRARRPSHPWPLDERQREREGDPETPSHVLELGVFSPRDSRPMARGHAANRAGARLGSSTSGSIGQIHSMRSWHLARARRRRPHAQARRPSPGPRGSQPRALASRAENPIVSQCSDPGKRSRNAVAEQYVRSGARKTRPGRSSVDLHPADRIRGRSRAPEGAFCSVFSLATGALNPRNAEHLEQLVHLAPPLGGTSARSPEPRSGRRAHAHGILDALQRSGAARS